jgi:hypothetical protein
VAARAGDVRSAIDGALNELVGYADDAAEAMRASTADVDGVLGGEGGSSVPGVSSVGAAAADAVRGTWVTIAREVVADAAQCAVFPLMAASRSSVGTGNGVAPTPAEN